jgi:hypothetical protein
MPVQVKRMYLDFVATDYTTASRDLRIISGRPKSSVEQSDTGYERWVKKKVFTLRCYLSLQGEDSPTAPPDRPPSPETPEIGAGLTTYRYDWAFGITLLDGFYWNWMKELPDVGALAIHLALMPEPFEDGPEAIPIAAILSTLHPSKNTKSVWEQALPMVPKTAAEMAKIGASALPLLSYVSSGLMLGSNVLASYTGNEKNWFLYQFVDEQQKCPVVEWRINRKVLSEYGPMIRGTLFLAFQNSAKCQSGTVRILFRPQIRYHPTDELCYIVPTNKLKADAQVYIDVCPATAKAGSG